MTVRAIYEKGIFRPTEPVNLPEKSEVKFEPVVVLDAQEDRAAQERIYKILMQSVASGESDVAERHNEHQP